MASVDVVCTDKTGTLTTSNLTVDRIEVLTGDEAAVRAQFGLFAWATVDAGNRSVQALRAAGVTPRFAVEGGEMDAVLRLVEAGTGVAVVPDLVFAGRPRLRRTVLTPPLFRTVALARRADLAPTHAVRAFRDTLLGFLAELSAGGGFSGDVQVLCRPD